MPNTNEEPTEEESGTPCFSCDTMVHDDDLHGSSYEGYDNYRCYDCHRQFENEWEADHPDDDEDNEDDEDVDKTVTLDEANAALNEALPFSLRVT